MAPLGAGTEAMIKVNIVRVPERRVPSFECLQVHMFLLRNSMSRTDFIFFPGLTLKQDWVYLVIVQAGT